MNISVSGSMAFSQDMVDLKRALEKAGHTVVIPDGAEDRSSDLYLQRKETGWGTLEGASDKAEGSRIKTRYQEIAECDALLVVNKEKNATENFIGGGSFLEMGFAFVLGKAIYTLNPLPQTQPVIFQELVAMDPIVLGGDISRIPKHA